MTEPLTAKDCYRALGEHHLECETCAPGGWPVQYREKCPKGRAIFAAWKTLQGARETLGGGWYGGPA